MPETEVSKKFVGDEDEGNALLDYLKTQHEPTDNVFCATGTGGGIDPTCSPQLGTPGSDSAANRPTKPSERHKNAAPKPLPWVDPPPKQGKKGEGVVRKSGEEAQGKIGDLGELMSTTLGFRNILPEGKRSFTAAEVKAMGSSIDLEYDHSGKLFELKLCNTTSTEYRLKAKLQEKQDKERYAKKVKGTLYLMVGVRDVDNGIIHYYGAKEPGLIGKEISPKHYDYYGSVKYFSKLTDKPDTKTH